MHLPDLGWGLPVVCAVWPRGALRRLSIGWKLIGLVTVLLLVMFVVAAYSFYKATMARRDVADLSERLIPLASSLSGVDAAVTEQEVALERALRYLGDPRIESDELDATIASFRQLGERTLGAIRDAKREARNSARAATVPADIEQLANVQARLAMLQRDHRAFSRLGLELIEARRAGGEAAGAEVNRYRERQLAAQVGELEELMRELVAGFNDYIASRSRRVGLEQERRFHESLRNVAFTGIAFLFGLAMAVAITRLIVRPLRELVGAAQKVQEGDLDVEVRVGTEDEVGELAGAFNTMVAGLRTRERVKQVFGTYVDPRIVENLIEKVEVEGERRVMTVFFSDVVGFSSIGEQLTPSGLVKIINRYFTLATEPIVRHSGVVDKFIGDAVMAFWGPPFTSPDEHARLACTAALEQFDQLEELRRQLPELLGFRKGLPQLDIRIGLCTGDLVVGEIGSQLKKSFTVMGDTVNVASRLEGVNKQYGTRILLAEETYEQVKGEFETREIDLITVVGKKEPTRVYELLAAKGTLEPAARELRDSFEQGLASYRQQDWKTARSKLQACLEIDPKDGPARVFLDRIADLEADAPGPGWDGVWRLRTK